MSLACTRLQGEIACAALFGFLGVHSWPAGCLGAHCLRAVTRQYPGFQYPRFICTCSIALNLQYAIA